jgi:hypothetical protein
MSATELDTAFLEGGLRSTYFFNGRIVSGEDMRREQDAARAIHERLGVALGDGVAYGLEVSATAIGGSSVTKPVVTVKPGLAVSGCGQTLTLDRNVDVALLGSPKSGAANATNPVGFCDCTPPQPSVYVSGNGVYILTVAPAQAREGLATVSGLGNAAAPCNAKSIVDGVQFRLVQVNVPAATLADARVRNLVAYLFFAADGAGTEATRDPFGPPATPPQLTTTPLSNREVPLAVLQWTSTGGIRFVDMWSVRRRLAPRPIGPWMQLADPHRLRLGEAMFLQFQEQLGSMPAAGPIASAATALFRYLPPIGFLPIGPSDFDFRAFFNQPAHRDPPAVIEGARLRALMLGAFAFPPIDLTTKDLVWLYYVRENMKSIADGEGARPYLVFTSGHVPYQGDAREDLSRWNFSNFALPVSW